MVIYTLEVPSGKNILEISYIGYKTKEITIGNNSLIKYKKWNLIHRLWMKLW